MSLSPLGLTPNFTVAAKLISFRVCISLACFCYELIWLLLAELSLFIWDDHLFKSLLLSMAGRVNIKISVKNLVIYSYLTMLGNHLANLLHLNVLVPRHQRVFFFLKKSSTPLAKLAPKTSLNFGFLTLAIFCIKSIFLSRLHYFFSSMPVILHMEWSRSLRGLKLCFGIDIVKGFLWPFNSLCSWNLLLNWFTLCC